MRLLIEEQHEIERQIIKQIELEKMEMQQVEKKKTVQKHEQQKWTGNVNRQRSRVKGRGATTSSTAKSHKISLDSSTRKQKQPHSKPNRITLDESTARAELDVLVPL